MNKSARNHRRRPDRRQSQSPPDEAGPLWLWGSHAVAAAAANPARTLHRLVATANAERRLGLDGAETIEAKALDRLLPPGAVHQGVACLAEPLEPVSLEAMIEAAPARLAVLDQVSDPHNLGAIFRSAAAFGVAGLVLQTRHTPPVTGIVAKSAAGAVESVAEIRVVNIARTLEALSKAGYLVVGLAGEAEMNLAEAVAGTDRLAIVLGAEGAGLRPAVAGACDRLARIEIAPTMESLNVSNAAAIAFYEAARGAFSPD